VPDIKIHREHSLGLARARKIAWQWAEEVEAKFDMSCTVVEGEFSDTVEFTRSGVNGRLVVAADHFDLEAKLGFLLGAFSKTIEAEIEKNLDTLLAAQAKPAKATAKTAAKDAPKVDAKASAKADTKATAKAVAKPAARKTGGG
jgi:putative polyhydroxyalkanoate system protein